ncbi:hypothetical protein VTG60DRAFT_442 [Thermothelomyces hinnuleus]
MNRKLAMLTRAQQSEQLGSLDWFNPDHAPDARALIRLVVVQPLRLLGTEPIVIMVTGSVFSPVYWTRESYARGLERGKGIQPQDHSQVHWLVPTAALVPIGFAVNEMAYTLSAYLTDTYQIYAASAFCGLAFVRALVSGLMPLVAQRMYPALGANIAGTVVASFAIAFCLASWVLFRYDKLLREKSPFARHSLESHRRSQIPMQKLLRDV